MDNSTYKNICLGDHQDNKILRWNYSYGKCSCKLFEGGYHLGNKLSRKIQHCDKDYHLTPYCTLPIFWHDLY